MSITGLHGTNEFSASEQEIETTCCIVGGGPDGIITGLLLERQGRPNTG